MPEPGFRYTRLLCPGCTRSTAFSYGQGYVYLRRHTAPDGWFCETRMVARRFVAHFTDLEVRARLAARKGA